MKEIIANGEKIVIRKAVPSDAKAMLEFVHTIAGESDFLTFGVGEFEKTIEEEKVFIESTLGKDNVLFIIAEIKGKVIGNLSFTGGFRSRTAHTGEFGVSVLKEYWGNGIGEALIKYLIDWSKVSGIVKKINLRARVDNIRGISLYKKLGFLEEGIITRDFFVNGKFYDSLQMGLCID
ncbi:GNAT family N-acetyltransferase [Geosporobacter ferrireducens]|uniref:GNAT family N-acetyltransferase n=1 Tax=Geosporobacter ferrireducens TaxID=1424294 RepID=A0A1D8GCL1_9FIRM|nr:GNAT family protein [Geosporobacter ferrireducens]AOT68638.1 GNAT family N-acetyltransferase [Geosporobacter ferrireducens]MTI54110.1 GNAT family N-acetyltransferase [Geosporobacter ferrireducens]